MLVMSGGDNAINRQITLKFDPECQASRRYFEVQFVSKNRVQRFGKVIPALPINSMHFPDVTADIVRHQFGDGRLHRLATLPVYKHYFICHIIDEPRVGDEEANSETRTDQL